MKKEEVPRTVMNIYRALNGLFPSVHWPTKEGKHWKITVEAGAENGTYDVVCRLKGA